MKRTHPVWMVLSVGVLLTACADADAPASEAVPAAATAPAGPSPGEVEYAELTAAWSEATLEGCGRVLEEALGTRDLVQGALSEVRDDRGVAADEIEDANYWLGQGNQKIEEVRPRLVAGECDGDITLALDEAVQFYVKAGTSAVQAGQIAGS